MKILDDYRHEIVSNRRDIDIYKDIVVNIDFNIDFNSREINNNSNCEIEIDNISINRNEICLNNTSINTIISLKERNNNITYKCERGYTKSGIYNCKRGAYIASNRIYIDVVSIISKSEKEDDNINISVRV